MFTKLTRLLAPWGIPETSAVFARTDKTGLSALLRTFVSYVPLLKINVYEKYRKIAHSDSQRQKEAMLLQCLKLFFLPWTMWK